MKSRRQGLKLTQAQLAAKADTSQPQIARLENDERELTRAWAERLAPALKTSPVFLVFPELEMQADVITEAQMRAALLAYGVHGDDLPSVLKAISGFVSADDVQPEPDPPRDRSAPASRRRATAPSR